MQNGSCKNILIIFLVIALYSFISLIPEFGLASLGLAVFVGVFLYYIVITPAFEKKSGKKSIATKSVNKNTTSDKNFQLIKNNYAGCRTSISAVPIERMSYTNVVKYFMSSVYEENN